MISLLAASMLVLGTHPVAVAVVAFALVSPQAFLGSVAFWAVLDGVRRAARRSRLPVAEAHFFNSWAAELEGGASVRHAMISAARAPAGLSLERASRLASTGSPMSLVAGELAGALPVNGPVVAAAVECVSTTGAAAGPTFRQLALRARERAELERERRVGTSQARLTALTVGGAPLVLMLALVVTGRGPSWTGVSGVVAAIGAALIVAGFLSVTVILGRHAR